MPDALIPIPLDPAALPWSMLLAVTALLLLLGLGLAARWLYGRMRVREQVLSLSLQSANDELQRAVLFDSLTSLPNRRLLLDRLAQGVRRSDRDGSRSALLFIDLDGFKSMNDLFGQRFGDAVLCEVAHRLARVPRTSDTVARLGGDQFVMLLADVADAAAAQQVALRALVALAQPMALAHRELRLTASVGIALYPGDGEPGRLLAAADTAMLAAKRAGGAQVVFFAPQMAADAREQLELQRDLRDAVDQPQRGELSLHYQPKVDARDGRVLGVEALLRWRHPLRGPIGPGVFVPLAERFGLIDRLGAWVIEEACRQMGAWRAQGLVVHVAVNLSMHQLRHPGLVAHVQAALGRHGVAAGQLMFEITESAAMDDADAHARVFDELAALGTALSIDDFGTGYSSLAYLRRLPARQLKIDASFVQDLDRCADALAIVEAVVQLAHALGLRVVAEGVETAGQRDILRRLACDELQGYLYARPVPGDSLLNWWRGIDRPAALHFDEESTAAPDAAARWLVAESAAPTMPV